MTDRHFAFTKLFYLKLSKKRKEIKAMRTALERQFKTLATTYCKDMFNSVRPNSILAGDSEHSFDWNKYNNKQLTIERLRC